MVMVVDYSAALLAQVDCATGQEGTNRKTITDSVGRRTTLVFPLLLISDAALLLGEREPYVCVCVCVCSRRRPMRGRAFAQERVGLN